MIEQRDLLEMDYWFCETVQYGIFVADVIVFYDLFASTETPFIYPRWPAFCYLETIRDQVIIHTQDYDYLETLNMLKSHYNKKQITKRQAKYEFNKSFNAQ